MDAFEQLVSEILWHNGYWVRSSVKVELTKKKSGRWLSDLGFGPLLLADRPWPLSATHA